MRALILLLAFGSAFAQTGPNSLPPTGPKPMAPLEYGSPWCLPGIENTRATGSPLEGAVTKNGAWVKWWCVELQSGRVQVNTYVATTSELSKIGGRVQTIIKATDPLLSLQTLPKRVTVLPLTDPSLAAIMADVK